MELITPEILVEGSNANVEIQEKQIQPESETEKEDFLLMNTFDVKLEEVMVDRYPSQSKKKRGLPSLEGCYFKKRCKVQGKTTFCNSCSACKSEIGQRSAIKRKENAQAKRAESAADNYFLNIIDQEKEAAKKQATKEKDEKRQQRRENREKRLNEGNLKKPESAPAQSKKLSWCHSTMSK